MYDHTTELPFTYICYRNVAFADQYVKEMFVTSITYLWSVLLTTELYFNSRDVY